MNAWEMWESRMCDMLCGDYENMDPAFKDLHGFPVKRPPTEFPYSYDEYVQYKVKGFKEANYDAVYSDRLRQWDYEKYCKVCHKVFHNCGGVSFDGRDPKDIERFLSGYLGKPVKLGAVLKGCNVANGNPYWVFFYNERRPSK